MVAGSDPPWRLRMRPIRPRRDSGARKTTDVTDPPTGASSHPFACSRHAEQVESVRAHDPLLASRTILDPCEVGDLKESAGG